MKINKDLEIYGARMGRQVTETLVEWKANYQPLCFVILDLMKLEHCDYEKFYENLLKVCICYRTTN